jgi:hypothetical protein
MTGMPTGAILTGHRRNEPVSTAGAKAKIPKKRAAIPMAAGAEEEDHRNAP